MCASPPVVFEHTTPAAITSPLYMGRDWITDRLPKISDEQLKFVHEYIDNKGKNVLRGPATVKGPDGRLIEVLRDEEVEILGGMVYRTFLNGFPPVNEARLKEEGKVCLEIRWSDNWETEGFTLEVSRSKHALPGTADSFSWWPYVSASSSSSSSPEPLCSPAGDGCDRARLRRIHQSIL